MVWADSDDAPRPPALAVARVEPQVAVGRLSGQDVERAVTIPVTHGLQRVEDPQPVPIRTGLRIGHPGYRGTAADRRWPESGQDVVLPVAVPVRRGADRLDGGIGSGVN